ncbi:alpha/beta hydrolase [Mucilaginibacter sp. SG564]|uniref:alpha/beta hydrolase n=1 Tax=unclassified Mucilaginibacter TaxID=2617802 RepID=UPI001554C707|nr:alpha/beta hydrolase [Mucilaginibacter sp. SG564]NOW97881.1 acetyl esterase/lipase [Mucilaginibacter sp. SG564]
MKMFALILIFSGWLAHSFAQEPMPLYPSGIPNSKPTPATYREKLNEWGGIAKVSIPTLTPYLIKDGAMHTAVLVIPGGGYSGVAMGHEGEAIASAFNKIGIIAFVLKYRLPSDSIMVDKTIGPLQDAQSALCMIRKNAKLWNIDPAKVGVIGFSAGGHLASTLGTHFDKPAIKHNGNISLRPDFMALIYPVISFGTFAHIGSRDNLIGNKPSPQFIDLYSNEKQVTAATPPTFLVHAEDDNVVPVQNTLLFYDALLQNKVRGEMHIYAGGGHGFGLYNSTTHDYWFERLKEWMGANGWLK